MSNKEKESLLITIQIISSIVSIGTVIISIILLYLKIIAKTSKNNTYGTYNISHLLVSSDQTFLSYYALATTLKSYFVANGQSSSDVTSFQTFTLNLNMVKNSVYYVSVHNCDSEFYVQKIWLTNNA